MSDLTVIAVLAASAAASAAFLRLCAWLAR